MIEKIRKNQSSIISKAGKFEQNVIISTMKKTFISLNILLIINGFIMIVDKIISYFNPNFLYLKDIIGIISSNYSLVFIVLFSIFTLKSGQKNSEKVVISTIVFFLMVDSLFNQQLHFTYNQILLALISILINVAILNLYNFLLEKIDSFFSTSMNTVNYIFTAIFYTGFFMMSLYLVSLLISETNLMTWVFVDLNIDNPVAVFVVVITEMFFWYVGINGYGVISPIVLLFATHNLNLNAQLIAAGSKPIFIFTPNFWDYFLSVTGSGIIGALFILSFISKKKVLNKLAKSTIKSTLFSVSEPYVYGIPLTMNSLFFLPFVVGTASIGVLQWYIFKIGLINVPTYHVADLPIPFSTILSTMDLRSIILTIGSILLATLIYLPSFYFYENTLIEAKPEEDKYKDLDLDF